MDRETLADRIITYSDTVVAFAIVNGFAFVVTLADPDIRCSIARVGLVVFGLNVIFPIVGTFALFWLRGYEDRLREGAKSGCEEEDEAGSETAVDPVVARFRTATFRIRLGLVWVFATLVLLGVFAATRDPACSGAVG